jgi:phytoene dehydrogenase-like protein
MKTMDSADVIIVGGGLAGLSCAVHLRQAGLRVQLLEQKNQVGGRVATDDHDGFRLDHGFQVLLTAYPTCRAWLDYENLDLGRFDPGAVVQLPGGRRHGVSDPFRQPLRALPTALAPIGTLGDKWRVLRLRALLKPAVPAFTSDWTGVTAEEWLTSFGFSARMLHCFFRPFFAGIFLESALSTSAWMLGYTYHYFTCGYAALPRGGMRAIPEQLARRVGPGVVRTGMQVAAVQADAVTLADGTRLEAKAVVVAVDGDTARAWFPQLPAREWRSAGCFYFDADESPLRGGRSIWLNGTGEGRINQVAVPSDIAAGYAPAGRALVNVGVVGEEASRADPEQIRKEAETYFGEKVRGWRFLRSYAIPKALPVATPAALSGLGKRPARIDGVHLCGDHLSVGSIEAAMAGGIETAQAVVHGFLGESRRGNLGPLGPAAHDVS